MPILFSMTDDGNLRIPIDGEKLLFGQDDSAQIYYDSQDFIIGFTNPSIGALTQKVRINDDLLLDGELSGLNNSLIIRSDITVIGTMDTVDKHIDVDTTTSTPNLNEVLKWDGVNWIPSPEGAVFTFSINTYDHGESALVEIGGVGANPWQASGNITFTMVYNNGPATDGEISMTTNGGSPWISNLTLTDPFTTQISGEDTDYPTSKDTFVRFDLDVNKDAQNDTDQSTAIWFRNRIRWGDSALASGWVSADIVALSGSVIDNDHTRSGMAVTSMGATDYVLFAHPFSYSTLTSVNFSYNGLVIRMNAPTTVSVTNASSFTEDYKVYRSFDQQPWSLSSGTLRSDHSQAQNYIYWDGTLVTDTYSESDIEGSDESQITNDNTQVWTALTLGSGEYVTYSQPDRMAIPTFWNLGFVADMSGLGGTESSPAYETVSVTNSNGYVEDYKIWRSFNVLGSGSFILETK
jgi:hypothetical protein